MSTVDVPSSQPPLPYDEQLWGHLTAGADRAEGHDLQQDKEVLVGVPFLITGATIRDGVKRPDGTTTNYVSVEATVGALSVISQRVRAGRLTPEAASKVTPLEQLVFNDGSTGLCRQIAAYLFDKGRVNIPEGANDGADGESRWDTHYSQWTVLDGIVESNGHLYFPGLQYLCERGLRYSDYPNPNNPAATSRTYYIG